MAISEALEPRQPHIGYTPDHDKYLARVKQRLATEKLEKSLPSSFPPKLESDLVWDKTNIASRFKWTYELTELDLQEVEDALKHFKSFENRLAMSIKTHFLFEISNEIHNGFGFKIIRSLPV